MKNGNKYYGLPPHDVSEGRYTTGLTKREYTCIELGIPETGDPVLDDLIRKAERKKIAAQTMQGLLAGKDEAWSRVTRDEYANQSVKYADALLNQLEATNEE